MTEPRTVYTDSGRYDASVLHTFERNGYSDSDFYAVAWDREAGEPVQYEIGSTRYCGGRYNTPVTASAEDRAAYEAWLRRARILERRRRGLEQAAQARALGLPDRFALARLMHAIGAFWYDGHGWSARYKSQTPVVDSVTAILTVKKFRSEFRASIAAQIRTWAADPAPRYHRPLTERQLAAIVR